MLGVPARQGCSGSLSRAIGGALDVPFQEGADHPLRLRPQELLDDRAVTIELDQGDALDSIGPGQIRVFIDVDADELHPARVVSGDLGQDRGEHATRGTPRRPEIHHDRQLTRALDDAG